MLVVLGIRWESESLRLARNSHAILCFVTLINDPFPGAVYTSFWRQVLDL